MVRRDRSRLTVDGIIQRRVMSALVRYVGTHFFRTPAKEFAAMQCYPEEQSLIISKLDLARLVLSFLCNKEKEDKT
jgi:hypothetical protein